MYLPFAFSKRSWKKDPLSATRCRAIDILASTDRKRTALTLCRTFEDDIELLHIVVDQCDLVIAHHELHDICLYSPLRTAHLDSLNAHPASDYDARSGSYIGLGSDLSSRFAGKRHWSTRLRGYRSKGTSPNAMTGALIKTWEEDIGTARVGFFVHGRLKWLRLA